MNTEPSLVIAITDLILRITLASVFAFAGIGKLRDLGASGQMLREFGVPGFATGVLSWLVPILELATAAALVLTASTYWGALAAAALLVVFTAFMLVNIALGRRPRCRCFGQRGAKPIGPSSLVRNLVLLGLALLIVSNALRQGDFLLLSWAGANAGKVGGGVVLAFLAAQTFLLLQILRQQGRILLHLDGVSTMGAVPVARNEDYRSSALPGLRVGEAAPNFDVPLLGGGRLTLTSLLSAHKPVLIFFMHPGCGPCRALLPRVARWNSELAAKLTFAVISEGSVRENRQFFGDHTVLSVGLQERQDVSTSFAAYGTPGAVMINAKGRIQSHVAAGADEIETLVTALIEPLVIGDTIPELSAKTGDGHVVTLGSFKGRELILLFWNAQCGYCRAIANEVIEFDRKRAMDLVVVAPSDDPELTRELSSRFLLDPNATWSRTFGASGTPTAIRIDARGLVASTVAAGKNAVLSLLYEDRELRQREKYPQQTRDFAT